MLQKFFFFRNRCFFIISPQIFDNCSRLEISLKTPTGIYPEFSSAVYPANTPWILGFLYIFDNVPFNANSTLYYCINVFNDSSWNSSIDSGRITDSFRLTIQHHHIVLLQNLSRHFLLGHICISFDVLQGIVVINISKEFLQEFL